MVNVCSILRLVNVAQANRKGNPRLYHSRRACCREMKSCFSPGGIPHCVNSDALPNSVVMIATKYGMNVSLLCPSPEYVLDERFMKAAQENAAASGGRLSVTHEIRDGYEGADVVYANSWGALPYYGDPEREWDLSRAYVRFIVDEGKMAMTNKAIFSHCLPVRRNVEATDAVLDAPSCVAIDEAENRLHVQKALMLRLLGVAARST